MSAIPSLPAIETGSDSEADFASADDQPKSTTSHILPEFDSEDDLSLSEEALGSLSRSGFPEAAPAEEKTPRKQYDYSMSLKSEAKVRELSFNATRLAHRPEAVSLRQIPKRGSEKTFASAHSISYENHPITHVFTHQFHTA